MENRTKDVSSRDVLIDNPSAEILKDTLEKNIKVATEQIKKAKAFILFSYNGETFSLKVDGDVSEVIRLADSLQDMHGKLVESIKRAVDKIQKGQNE